MGENIKPGKNGPGDQSGPEQDPEQAVTLLSVIASVFASFFGVQKDKNRRRDFESGKFWHFFAAGLLFVLVFLLAVWGAVKYMLATTPTG
ncbi:MAG: DUF2970 domain-containing protein [Arenicellales bacterium]